MVLHKYRGVKALEVGFSSSGGGSGSSSLGWKSQEICKIPGDELWERPGGG